MKKYILPVLFIFIVPPHSFAKSNPALNSAGEISDPKLRALNVSGVKALHENRNEDAITIYTNFIQLAPQRADAYANRGTAYLNLKAYDKSFSDYETALKLDPTFRKVVDPSQPLVSQGMDDIDAGNLPEAEMILLKATIKILRTARRGASSLLSKAKNLITRNVWNMLRAGWPRSVLQRRKYTERGSCRSK